MATQTSVDDGRTTPAPGAVPPLRAAIVGAGFMGRVHARALQVAGSQLVGVTAASPTSAREAAAALRAERAYEDLDQLLEDASVDVVHVCTPNHLHAPIALAALEAGKHVVCEKPLATDVPGAERLVATAERTGRVGTVPFVYRFHPMVREARAMVRAGEVGRIAVAHGSYLQDWLLDAADDNWRVDADLGGPTRAFGDIGSHWCDLLEFVTGDRIARLSARLATVNDRRGETEAPVRTEDVVTLQFESHAGVPGSCVISQVSAGRKNRLYLEISGAEATLAFDQEDAERLWVGTRTRSATLVRDPDTLSPEAARYARVPAGHPQGYQDCFDHFVADTYAATVGPAPDGLPTFRDGLRATRLADAVLRSAAEVAWVEVAP
jgi:predicted dehydrogenase